MNKFGVNASHCGSGTNCTAEVLKPYAFDKFLYPYLYTMILVGAVGIITNGFALLVIRLSRLFRDRPSCVLLVNQTICDICASAVTVVTFTVAMTTDGELSGTRGELLCRLVISESLLLACFFASGFTLVGLTTERYLVVVHPFRYQATFTRGVARAMAAAAWVVGASFLVPTLVTTTVTDGRCQVRAVWSTPAARTAYYCSLLVGTFLLPLAAVLYGYGRVLRVLATRHRPPHPPRPPAATRKSPDTGDVITSAPDNDDVITSAQRHLTRTMIVVSAAFVLTTGPHQLYFACYQLGLVNLHYSRCHALLAVSLLNCLVNPVIYCFTLPAFRAGARAVIVRATGQGHTVVLETGTSRV